MDTKTLKILWEVWDIRVFIIISLLIQVVLTFLAPRRKNSTSSFLNFSMWTLYLSANAVAIFTIGLITSCQGGDAPQDQLGAAWTADLRVFWAPFLLIHLGGPDTITALAMEDNELWLRHLLQLVTQVSMTLYVFVLSVAGGKNELWLPTALIFFDGFIKYFERTCALYFANMDTYRNSVRSLMLDITYVDEYLHDEVDEVIAKVHNGTTTMLSDDAGHWYHVEETYLVVQFAYDFYEKFKRLIAGATVNQICCDESLGFFMTTPNSEAYRIVEMELNIIYDVFYTKAFLLHEKLGYARFFSFFSIVASLVIFCIKDKSNFHKIDAGIIFVLLGGAIGLDILAAVMFALSDWWIIVTSWKRDCGHRDPGDPTTAHTGWRARTCGL